MLNSRGDIHARVGGRVVEVRDRYYIKHSMSPPYPLHLTLKHITEQERRKRMKIKHLFKIKVSYPCGSTYLCGPQGVYYFPSRARAEQCAKHKYAKIVEYNIIKCSLNDVLELGVRGHL